ncbi:MAG: DUF4132 domain-containing protein [Lachnospiraceae bacterium]|nr:DUF4132 domain-containing protein [Lachnospiraceae bacterium]
MGYDWNSRKKLVEDYKAEWKKKNQPGILLMTPEQKKLLEEMDSWHGWQQNREMMYQALDHYEEGEKPSEFMKRHYKQLVKCCVPKNLLEDYYRIIDKYNQFQYAGGMWRRSMRSPNYWPFMERVFLLLDTYRIFGMFHCSVDEYLKNELSEEYLDFKKSNFETMGSYIFDDCLAARIDAGDKEVEQSIREILLSENNTAVVSVEIIRGIMKSSDTGLHQLLCDFLLAARLQEGVRQAVLENADCGCMEAFLRLIDTVKDNNLLRFASVKRAIATWTGVCSVEHMDRITEKVFGDIVLAIHDKDQAYAMTKSDDSIHIMIGLWALGAKNIKDALKVMEGYVETGSRNQKLTMSYFNIELQNGRFASAVAKKMLETHADDYEFAAAFMPTYMQGFSSLINKAVRMKQEKGVYGVIRVDQLHMSRDEAYRHFELLMKLYCSMPKKKLDFSPCIFPWYGVTLTKGALVIRMAVLAYALNDESLTDRICCELSNIGESSDGRYYSSRHQYVELLLHDPTTEKQRETLIDYVADRETMTQKSALVIVEGLELKEQEYRKMESFLRFKDGNIRKNVLSLLNKQEKGQILESAHRLLMEKSEEMHLGGLDLLRSVKKEDDEGVWEKRILELLQEIETPTPKEKILIEEIEGSGSADEIVQKEGFGLYDVSVRMEIPKEKANLKEVQEFFSLSKKELDRIIEALNDFLDAHGMMEYRDLRGNERLLCNGLYQIKQQDGKIPVHACYPFPELWQEFYDKWIKTPKVLLNLYYALLSDMGQSEIENFDTYMKYERQLFSDLAGYVVPDQKYMKNGLWGSTLMTVVNILRSMKQAIVPHEVLKNVVLYITQEMPKEALWYPAVKRGYMYVTKRAFVFPAKMRLINSLGDWKDNEGFRRMFWLYARLDMAFDFNNQETTKGVTVYGGSNSNMKLTMADYVKAYTLGMIGEDNVYHAAFEDIGIKTAVNQLGVLMKEKMYPYEKQQYKAFFTDGEIDFESDAFKAGKSFYLRIVDTILDVELKRGDSPTIFSESICAIQKIYGINRLVAILTALGKEPLDRQSYYGFYGRSDGKRECLCHLLQVCHPAKEDTSEKLGELLKDSGITRERLIETAMYAPQWLDIVEGYLGWEGLKSGCYYFMAHMNERFDDRKAAMIAKYTPLTKEELNDGAFDVEWFWDACRELGQERFDKLYKAAKYISDGSKHSRARKYADAARELVTTEELEEIIQEKRNKDYLMSYGIIPVKGTKELLHRYEFLQRFLKESKQFGAQRRASEGRAVEMAMKNLATTAGYPDVTRLTLAMETGLVKENMQYLEGITVSDYCFKVVVDRQGNADLEIYKGEKKQKSIPAALKKNEEVAAISEFKKKLKEQYSRTVKMFEQGMENREIYSFKEINSLCENPVTDAILKKLVWVSDKGIGLLAADGLENVNGLISLEEDDSIWVAHPWDLHQSGEWTAFQRYFFELSQKEKVKQPFKQVFRELYVKLPEELEKEVSMMFAGNQIQPKKTLACLKGRRWIADVEEGLQKIYYKENIIAGIYALADWFSPADVEAPTLEYVVFYDRKNFNRIKIKDVPDLIYSEVMRDVDLAVSVAHAGGVDPETSHSTIEMRRVIGEFNAELFGLKNVTFEKSHALIEGTRAKYSIHLGSGVIHQLGGHQLNVLPVHSQSRGKIFLPFLDEDPKTAEIMSKILLFAQDNKIKDPYILEQIS